MLNSLDCYDALRREEDIHVLSGALKLFLRELQEPIFPVPMHKDFMSAMSESIIDKMLTDAWCIQENQD